MKPNGQPTLPPRPGRWFSLLFPALILAVAVAATLIGLPTVAGVVWLGGAALLLLGVAVAGHVNKQIKAGVRHDVARGNGIFTLALDEELVSLEPGKTWPQLDHYKWVVRGLIEEPQMFHVSPDGSIEINSERININDAEGVEKLEHQINKRHTPIGAHKPQASTPSDAAGAPGAQPPDPRRFRVKLDHLGHVVIEWGHGVDREETGLRGIAALITNELIRKPDHYRVDPMQRSIEIDGTTFECNEAGVKRLEEALNTRYAPITQGQKGVAIEIKENLAASTGFDIHFRTTHAGIVHEIKGHLSQELLDLLQDPQKCDLLQPGIHLLLTPPYLLIRRRRPDMGEEKIPDLPDVNFLRLTAAQLQQMFNHPLIHRGGTAVVRLTQDLRGQSEQIAAMRVIRSLTDQKLLWLEWVTTRGEKHGEKAFTHHNIADLQHGGFFQPHLDVCLSLDHRKLSILNKQTHQEESLTLDVHSADEDLRTASRMLTNALKPVSARAAINSPPTQAAPQSGGNTAPRNAPAKERSPLAARQEIPTIAPPPPVPAAPTPGLDFGIVTLFRETDAARINQEVFRRLCVHLGIAAQEIHLSRPMVFENRRYEVLNFERQEINDLMQLRGTDFYGFYLSHVSEKKNVLVYACNGMHIEWGADKCVLQPTIKSEPEEYKGSVLLGMAQDKKDEFVFVVQPEFKKWIAPKEMPFTEENLKFLVVADLAAAPDEFKFIWPERNATAR